MATKKPTTPKLPNGPPWPKPRRNWIPLWLAPFRVQGSNAVGSVPSSDLEEEYTFDWDRGLISVTPWSDPSHIITRPRHPLRLLDSYSDEIARAVDGKERVFLQRRWENVSGIWADLLEDFQVRAVAGVVKIVARRGSPFRNFTIIPGDVWRHFTIDDWWNGIASGPSGERLFSIFMLPEGGPSQATDADRAAEEAEAKKRFTRRPRDQERGFTAFVKTIYPEGLDENMSSPALARAYADWFKNYPDARRQQFHSTVSPKSVAKWRKNLRREEGGSGN